MDERKPSRRTGPRIFFDWLFIKVEPATRGMGRCASFVAAREGEEGAPSNHWWRTTRAEV
jgi:hypothetical protein